MDTETVAVIASSAVAIAAIAASWLQHRGNMKHAREVTDLDNVRDVLDDAAVALHRTAALLDRVRDDVGRNLAFFKTEPGAMTYGKLAEEGEQLRTLTARLALRFGRNHRVVSEFAEADASFFRLYAAVKRLEYITAPSPAIPSEFKEIAQGQRDMMGTQRQRFDIARDGFMTAAHDVAGARLR